MICKVCGVESAYQPISLSEIKRPIKYLVIRNYPDVEDQITGKPWSSNAGSLLKQLLERECYTLGDFQVHYLACCVPKSGTLTKEQILLSCEQLNRVIRETTPQKIIALGDDSLNAIFGYGKSKRGRALKDYRGFWTDLTICPDYTIPVYTTFDPRRVMEAPSAFFDDFQADLYRLRQLGFLPQPKVVIVTGVLETRKVLNKNLCYGYIPGDFGVRAFDIETTGLDFHPDSKDQIVSLSIAGDEETVYIWPQVALANRQILDELQKYFNRPELTFTGHNAIRFDCPFMWARLGLDVPVKYDTLLLHYVLHEKRGTHGLKRLGLRYFGIPNWERGVNAAKEKQKLAGKQVNYGDIDPLELYYYQAYDTVVTLLCYHRFLPEVNAGYRNLYENIVYPAARLTEHLHARGMQVDVPYLKQLQSEWAIELSALRVKLEAILAEYHCEGLNLNSPQQLSKFLHETLLLRRVNARSVAKSGMGKMKAKYDSTSEAVLKYLEPYDKSGFISALLNYRRLTGLKAKYVDGILSIVDSRNLIYPNQLVHSTETGRLSATAPNLMAFPKKSKPLMGINGPIYYAQQIRHCFVPRKGFKIVTSDYSQIELRYLAWDSMDEAMIAAFRSNIDIHTSTAEAAFGKSETKEQAERLRGYAKTTNFLMAYGGSDAALAAMLGLEIEQAATIRKTVLGVYPRLISHLEILKRESLKQGYAESAFGRRRRFPLIPDNRFRASFERAAGNHPSQSGASDICLLAAIEIDQTFTEDEVNVLLLIHDDIVMEINADRVEELTARVVEIQQKHRLEYRGIVFKAEPEIMPTAWSELKVDKVVSQSIIDYINEDDEEEADITPEEVYAN